METIVEKIKDIVQNQFWENIDIKHIVNHKIKIEKTNILYIEEKRLEIKNNLYIISIGKVAYRFMKSLLQKLKENNIEPVSSIIITDSKYTYQDTEEQLETKDEVLISTHPHLSIQSIDNTEKIINFLRQKDSENSCFLFLISGGGSSLFEYPIIKPDLAIEIYKYILLQNLDIYQLNTIRKFFSNVKAGKILQYVKKSQIVSIILSDVPFNDLSTIASGITFIQKPTIRNIEFISETLKPIIDHYNIHQTERKNIQIYQEIENSNENLDKINHFIIADNTFALKKMEEVFIKNKIETIKVCSHLKLPLKEIVNIIKGIITTNIDREKTLFLMGGETNLKIEKEGFGGRLQHLGLEILKMLKETPDISKEVIFFALATDGIDGNTNKSGCIISNKINVETSKIQKYIINFNSGLFFENPKNEKYSITIPPGLNNLNEIYGIYIS
ncbi:MAG: DUF4147 domain-containing protein [Candidatus Calescibacterium sp.]|nr:DUF4147 domain-containing protein [Candidatus Calescibacterium sp.]